MSNLNVKSRTIFCHDNLQVLEGINSDCIDLIYLDPPFNKKKVFTAPIGSSAEGAEFSDIFQEEDIKTDWVKSIEYENPSLHSYLSGVKSFSNKYSYCYLVYMSIRLIECHRILKDTGSIYLHCDPTMSHYLKIVMDCIFGEENFKNEIVWHYKTYQGKVKTYYPKKHDIMLVYLKSNKGEVIKNLEYKNNHKDTVDYERWNKFFVYKDLKEEKEGRPKNKIKFNFYPENDSRFKAYLKKWIKENKREPELEDVIYECKGYVVDDVFTDIQAIDPKDKKEKVGYPTQKPLALLERIIKAGTNEGDIVLDPFCGCATTCVAAEKLARKWIGIDISYKAYELVSRRLEEMYKERSDHSVAVPMLSGHIKAKYTTRPPTRGESEKQEQGYVYIISNDNWQGIYKVGIAKDPKSRLNSYQTSDPYRAYKLEYSHKTPYFREIEAEMHKQFIAANEWVESDIQTLKSAIKDIENKLQS